MMPVYVALDKLAPCPACVPPLPKDSDLGPNNPENSKKQQQKKQLTTSWETSGRRMSQSLQWSSLAQALAQNHAPLEPHPSINTEKHIFKLYISKLSVSSCHCYHDTLYTGANRLQNSCKSSRGPPKAVCMVTATHTQWNPTRIVNLNIGNSQVQRQQHNMPASTSIWVWVPWFKLLVLQHSYELHKLTEPSVHFTDDH